MSKMRLKVSMLAAIILLVVAPNQNLGFAQTDTQLDSPTDLAEEKFKKLQKEMEGTNSSVDPTISPTAKSNNANSPPKPIGVIALAIQVFLGLIFVLILAVVTIKILKRFQGNLLSKPGKAGNFSANLFEVLETCHVGSNQKVVAIRMHDEVGIIGVTAHGINLLTMLKEPAAEVRQAHLAESNSAAFSENLNKLLDRFKKPKRVADLLDEVKN